MEIHDKIKRIIDEMKLNNNSFAKLIGVTSTTIDSITIGRLQADGERKRTKPGFDLLQSIITHCHVNPEYFLEVVMIFLMQHQVIMLTCKYQKL